MFHLDRRLKKAELRRGSTLPYRVQASLTEHKRQAEKSKGDQLEMEAARKTKKNRIVEYSEDESDKDEESEWAVVGARGRSRENCSERSERTVGNG